jgi:hypothetical protein
MDNLLKFHIYVFAPLGYTFSGTGLAVAGRETAISVIFAVTLVWH